MQVDGVKSGVETGSEELSIALGGAAYPPPQNAKISSILLSFRRDSIHDFFANYFFVTVLQF